MNQNGSRNKLINFSILNHFKIKMNKRLILFLILISIGILTCLIGIVLSIYYFTSKSPKNDVKKSFINLSKIFIKFCIF